MKTRLGIDLWKSRPFFGRKLRRATWLALLVLAPATRSMRAQASYTASRVGDLQVGAGVSIGQSNYDSATLGGNGERLRGFNVYSTFDFREHFGVELNIRQTTPGYGRDVYERTYEAGGRYVYPVGMRLRPYAKLMYGRGVFNYPDNIANLAYNLVSAGGGLDYRLTRTINLRADYEHQRWFGFPLAPLAPNILTIGVAYHFSGEHSH